MICILNANRDPFFNLALEEYLLMNEEQDVFILWQSMPAVVVGKHQNTLAQVNFRFVRENNIHLVRRLSGGGTVFHGPGNLNFTYIMHAETGKMVDFGRFIMPVIQFLNTLGIKAEMGPRHEILVNGRKISGNAEHVHKNRVLHHGTLLFNADLDLLRESIRVVPGKYVDKAVQSNPGRVTNLAEWMPATVNLDSFIGLFMQYTLDRFNGKLIQPEESSLRAIQDLSKVKYKSWEWTYGWSPDYEFRGNAQIPEGSLHIQLKVHKGYIADCSLNSPEISGISLNRLKDHLIGTPHEIENLTVRIRESGFAFFGNVKCLMDLVYGFF